MTSTPVKSNLVTIEELPDEIRPIFAPYPYFNRVQSAVFSDIINSSCSLVITAPTGSGKTVLFELAIAKLLIDYPDSRNFKAVYVAPVKALCRERFQDWSPRFAQLGLSCLEVTGDYLSHNDLTNYQLILTTPEKWDSLTRRWRDNQSLVTSVKLMMIDEVHLLGDSQRGPILESIVCRMKTIAKVLNEKVSIRFLALSATIFNIEDLACWLGEGSAKFYRFGNEMRPVALKQVVRGYPTSKGQSAFQFDINLTYKIKSLIAEFSEGKPTLIFCSTRKGVVQTCQILVAQIGFHFTSDQLNQLNALSLQISDTKLRSLISKGVSYHHAGMITEDRVLVQDAFVQGFLPVLVATSTLAMGVNLPAHLVIIKSTQQYVAGTVVEYPETTILQMVGRAGRPQFDETATAVIMTRRETAVKYENLLESREVLESSLHLHLAEHFNSEVVLFTITDLGVAMDWLRSTFLYQRALKNPVHYGLSKCGSISKIEKDLETMLLREVNALQSSELVLLDENGMDISPTANGRIMSYYYINFQTFKLFRRITENETIKSLLLLISEAYEVNDSQLRSNERRILNELNENKGKPIIRFPIKGKIKTRELKVNCLAQASLGCLPISDPPLQQEALKIVNSLERVAKCLTEFLLPKKWYSSCYSSILLTKCLHARLWEDSLFVARQLDRIGATLGAALVAAGKTTFASLEQSHPQELEGIINRRSPSGNNIIEQVSRLPRYKLVVAVERESVLRCQLNISIEIANVNLVREQSTAGPHHSVVLLVGDSNNRLLHHRRIQDSTLCNDRIQTKLMVSAPLPFKIYVNLISEKWVGIDVAKDFIINPMAKAVIDSKFYLPSADNSHTQKKPKKKDTKTAEKENSVLPYLKTNFKKKKSSSALKIDSYQQSILQNVSVVGGDVTACQNDGKEKDCLEFITEMVSKEANAKNMPFVACFDLEPDFEDPMFSDSPVNWHFGTSEIHEVPVSGNEKEIEVEERDATHDTMIPKEIVSTDNCDSTAKSNSFPNEPVQPESNYPLSSHPNEDINAFLADDWAIKSQCNDNLLKTIDLNETFHTTTALNYSHPEESVTEMLNPNCSPVKLRKRSDIESYKYGFEEESLNIAVNTSFNSLDLSMKTDNIKHGDQLIGAWPVSCPTERNSYSVPSYEQNYYEISQELIAEHSYEDNFYPHSYPINLDYSPQDLSSPLSDTQKPTFISNNDSPPSFYLGFDEETKGINDVSPKRVKLDPILLEPIQSMVVGSPQSRVEDTAHKLRDEVLNIVETVLDKNLLEAQATQPTPVQDRLELLELAALNNIFCLPKLQSKSLPKESVLQLQPNTQNSNKPKLNFGAVARNLQGLKQDPPKNVNKFTMSQPGTTTPEKMPKTLKAFFPVVRNAHSQFQLRLNKK